MVLAQDLGDSSRLHQSLNQLVFVSMHMAGPEPLLSQVGTVRGHCIVRFTLLQQVPILGRLNNSARGDWNA